MKRTLLDTWSSLLRLVRFLLWYGVAVATLFYVLPVAGFILEQHYDALSGTVKFFSILGVLAVIAVWHCAGKRERPRSATGSAGALFSGPD